VKTLFVMYDSRCGLCTEVQDWLRVQPAYIDLQLLASDSDVARQMFPSLPNGELAVVSDEGDVWLGDHAFIVCLWALREFRGWARKLASPILRPMARQAFAAVSQNRQSVSRLLGLKSEAELKDRLREVAIPICPIQ
jgi:predicted DCC family thiol-disulfide oxidoreductase YuxK